MRILSANIFIIHWSKIHKFSISYAWQFGIRGRISFDLVQEFEGRDWERRGLTFIPFLMANIILWPIIIIIKSFLILFSSPGDCSYFFIRLSKVFPLLFQSPHFWLSLDINAECWKRTTKTVFEGNHTSTVFRNLVGYNCMNGRRVIRPACFNQNWIRQTHTQMLLMFMFACNELCTCRLARNRMRTYQRAHIYTDKLVNTLKLLNLGLNSLSLAD